MPGGSRHLEARLRPWMDRAACQGMVTSADEDIFFAPDLDELGGNRGRQPAWPPHASGRRWPSVTGALSGSSAWRTPSPLANSTASEAGRPNRNSGT